MKTKVCGTVAASAREVGHGPHAGWELTSSAPPSSPFSREPDAWRHTLIWYTGGPGDETINGSSGSDNLFGGDGNDNIFGSAGGDWLQGDGGADWVYGQWGADCLLGGTGDDHLYGGTENDSLVGNADNDFLYGEAGDDFLAGDAGDDYADGGAGNDRINGDAGNDTLLGGDGNDTFNYDNDTSYGPDNGWDRIDGGAGTDSIHYYEDNTTISLHHLQSIEQINVHGYANAELNLAADPFLNPSVTFDLSNTTIVNGALDITITGGSQADTLKGSALTDVIDGGGGSDFIQGGGGVDLLTGGANNDTFAFSNVTDSAFGSADTITDFAAGVDLIDLGAIDTDAVTSGDQGYTFLGTSAFTGAAGELRYDFDGTNTHVYGTGSGGVTNFEVVLAGNVSLSSTDFIL